MSLTTIKYGNSGKLSLSINNLDKIGKEFNEITDVIFMLKNSASQLDTAAPMRKEQSKGHIYFSGEKIIVKLEKSDFGTNKLKANTTYLVAIGIEFNSTGEYFEDEDDNLQRKLKVIQDKVRA